MKSSLMITDPNGWLDERYFQKLSARIRASLQGYVRRHHLQVHITPGEDYMLTTKIDLGALTLSTDTDEFFMSGSQMNATIEKFNMAGFRLGSVGVKKELRLVSHNTRPKRVPVLYVTFFMNVPLKHWRGD